MGRDPLDPFRPAGYRLFRPRDVAQSPRPRRDAAVLFDQREWFRTTLGSIGDAVIATDVRGRVKLLNRVAHSLTGWSQEEALDRPLADVLNIINEESRQRCEDPVAKVLQSGHVVGLANHTVLISKSGAERIIADSAAPIHDAGGRVTGVVLVFRDVTDTHRMERAIAEMASFPKLNPYPVVEADATGQVLYVNPAAERLFPNIKQLGPDHPWLFDWDSVVRSFHDQDIPSQLREVTIGENCYQQAMYYVAETGRVRTYGLDISSNKKAQKKVLSQNVVFEGMARIFEAALASPTTEVLGRTCLAVAEEVSGSKFGFLGEINAEGRLDDIVISDPGWEHCKIDPAAERKPPSSFAIHGIYGKAIQDGRGFFTNEPASHPDRVGLPEGHPPLTAFLGVPLVRDGKTVGMLALGNREGGYNNEQLEAMESLAPAIVEAFSRKRAEEALKQANDELESRVAQRTAELTTTNQALAFERRRFNEVLDMLPAYVVLLSPDYHVPFANRFFREHFGESNGRRCFEYLFGRSEPCETCETFTALKTMAPHRWEWTGPDGRDYDIHDFPFTDADGSTLILEMGLDITEQKRAEEEVEKYRHHLEELVQQRTGELEAANARLQDEIVERTRAEAERETAVQFLRLVNDSKGSVDLIETASRFFQEQSGCEAIGVRLKDGDDYPYFEVRGFPAEFVQAENSLCARDADGQIARDSGGNSLLECMCGNVICGRFDPSKPYFTPCGTFWTNGTTELLASTSDEDRLARTRNRCNGEGYESVALIALHVGDKRLGLLQLNDRRKDQFSPQNIAVWERLADYLAVALTKTRAEEALRRAKEEWEHTFNCVPDFIAILDHQHRVVRANQAMAQRLGVSPEQCVGVPCYQAVHGTDHPPEFCPHAQTIADGQQHTAEVHEDRLGGDFLVSTTPLLDLAGQLTGTVHVARDITAQKASEQQLRQLNRTLMAHSHSDQALLRATNEADYLEEVCKIIIEDCGHAMVWVGMAEDDPSKRVRPVACAGFEQGYLDTLNITWADTDRGRGPTGTAIRTGQACVCRDMLTDPAFAPWRAEAVKRGYASSVALPLLANGTAFGALTIYCKEANSVSDEQLKLLHRLVADFAYGITSLRLRAAHARAEEALRESREDLNRAQAVAQVGSWRLDVRHNELRWSDENHRLFSIPKGTPLSYETFLNAVHEDDREYVNQRWMAALHGEPYDIEHRIVIDGNVRWVREKAELEVDRDGVLQGGFGTTEDITDRKHAEQAITDREEELAAIYENAPLIMMLVDAERRVRKTNRLAEQFAGDGSLDLLGQRGGEALHCVNALDAPNGCGSGPHCNDCTVRRSIQETLETGRSHTQVEASLPLVIAGKTQTVTFLLSTTRVSVRNEPLVLVTIQDITERKQAEEALQWTAEELARSNEDLGQFAYVASHDLQEPLRMVTGFMQLLQKKYANRLDADADQFIEYAVDGAKRMQTLISDLLAYSRVGTRGRELAPTNVEAALQRALDNLRASIDEAGAEITHGNLPNVHGDGTQLAQLFQNLIGNALKFRGAAPPIIHVDARRESDRWVFSVHDNGIGIAPEFRERVFLIFQRLHTRQQYAGTGIGLAICKKIVDRHGGQIWVESQLGEGATFYFTLPAA